MSIIYLRTVVADFVLRCALPSLTCEAAAIRESLYPLHHRRATTMKISPLPRIPITCRVTSQHANKESFLRRASSARYLSPSFQTWSHPPSSTTIADDEVASLASQALHQLSLADLVKYCVHRSSRLLQLLTDASDMDGHRCARKLSSPRRTLPSPSCLSDSPTESSPCETCPSSSCRIQTYRRYTTTTSTRCRHCYPTNPRRLRRSRTKFDSHLCWRIW